MIKQISLLLVISFLLVSGCATNPVSKESEFMLFSEQQEVEMGKEYHPQISKLYIVYDDPELIAYVDRVGLKVAAVSHRSNLDYTFTVLDSPIVNAFAVPGGYVYVTRGILERMNSEDELASVLGHEIGHVSARHSMQRMSQQYGLMGVFLGVQLFGNSEDFEQWSPWVNAGAYLTLLNYGREAEYQADRLGAEYAVAAGYSPKGSTDMLRMIRKLHDSEPNFIQELMATHPPPAVRVDRARHTQREFESDVGMLAEKDNEYKTAIAGMVIGPNLHHGQAIGNAYFNKAYDCVFEFPASYTTYIGQPGYLFYGKEQDIEALALQKVDLEKNMSSRDFAKSIETQAKISPKLTGSKTVAGIPGWIAKYEQGKDDNKQYISRFYWVKEKTGYILSCVTSLQNRGRNDSTFNEAIATFRELTDAEKNKLSIKKLAVHTVLKGETIVSIAKKYNTTSEKIKEYNALETTNLMDGQKLKIPSS
ncbi:M48 family metalloprotease [Candidatus Margulisiibacteriota bacterium]